MKNITFLILLLLTSVSKVYADTIEKKVDPFTAIDVTGNYLISMIQGEEEKVVVINNDIDVDSEKILIENSGGTLSIKIKGDNFKKKDMQVTIYYKNVYTIDAKRGTEVTLETPLKGEVLTFTCSTGGQVKGAIEATTAKLKISSDGLMVLSGNAKILEMDISAGGIIQAIDVAAESTTANIKAGGTIKCTAGKKLSIKIAGGQLTYYGDPEILEESTSLGGTITKMKK